MSVRLPAAERREQLLDVAMTVFSEAGYHGASMNDVAAAAGVTKPVLYQHFPSKRDLYIVLVEDVGSRLSEAITAAAMGDDARSRAVGALTAYFQFVSDNQRAFHLLFGRGAPRDEEFGQGVRLVERRMNATITQLLDPSLGEARRDLVARAIMGMSEAVCSHWISRDTDATAQELAEEVADLMLYGLDGLTRS